MTAQPSIPYRHELDGLRAIAVLAVLGYHAGYNDFAGGFVGVDVFLVLSGYLITQQIMTALDQGRFSIGPFWLRRARRLLPAMLPVLALALMSALLLTGDGAFEEFTGHFLSAGLFFSNYQFLSEADYFARASDTNLLLHTWSLSLEWQFYLAMPFVLIALHPLGKNWVMLGLLGLSAASLGFAEYLIGTDRPQWAFFGVLPRFWEFALGGVLALVPPILPRVWAVAPALRLTGLGLILFTVASYSGGSFPGLGALVPVAGTALILAASITPRDPLRYVLELRALQWIGRRSYAIYLVHWPLMVTVTPSDMGNSEGPLSIALLVSIFLGHLIYRYVEMPVRNGERLRANPAILRYGGATLAVFVAIWALLISPAANALRPALPLAELRATLTQIDNARSEYFDLQARLNAGDVPGARICSFDEITGIEPMLDCLREASGSARTLLIGDSHGRDTLAALVQAYPDHPVVMLHQSSCVPATYIRGRSLCFAELSQLLAALHSEQLFERFILSSRWLAGEHTHTSNTLTALTGVPTAIIGPGMTLRAPLESLATTLGWSGNNLFDLSGVTSEEFAFDIAMVNADLRDLAESAGATYIDRFAMLCPGGACQINADGALLYFDEQHLSPVGLSHYAERLADEGQLQDFLSQ